MRSMYFDFVRNETCVQNINSICFKDPIGAFLPGIVGTNSDIFKDGKILETLNLKWA